tara:strand:+ start:599 stop:946 length:348 start_codon:yes stop_codon:yes gene_type:complete
MKKIIFAFILLGGLIYLSPPEIMAQEVSTSSTNVKIQQKIEKSKENLEKLNEKHQKAIQKLEKTRADFDKKNGAGKLSPNDVAKITKKLSKQTKSIEKIEKKIAKEEKFLRENTF